MEKRYTDEELDRLEDRLEVLEKRRDLFLTLAIVAFSITAASFLGALTQFTSILGYGTGSTILVSITEIVLLISAEFGIPAGIALLILRKVIFIKKINNINKIIDDELDLREKEKEETK